MEARVHIRRATRIAATAALVVAAAFPVAPASASQKHTSVRSAEKACVTSKGRPIARIALNSPKVKRTRKCSRKARRSSRRRVKAHIAPHFRRVTLADSSTRSRPVARAAR
jgi:hypothetical protein